MESSQKRRSDEPRLLDHIKVVCLSKYFSGSLASLHLADAGASVFWFKDDGMVLFFVVIISFGL